MRRARTDPPPKVSDAFTTHELLARGRAIFQSSLDCIVTLNALKLSGLPSNKYDSSVAVPVSVH